MATVRNNINHASEDLQGEKTVELTGESVVWKDVSERLKNFIECYQKVLDHIKGKPGPVMKISHDEVFDYIFEHGPRNNPNYLEVEGYTSQRRSRRKPDREKFTGKYKGKKWNYSKEENFSKKETTNRKTERKVSTVISTSSIPEQKKEIHLHIHLSLD